MLALSHVVLHIGFCNAIAQASPTTTVAFHVRLTDRRGTPQVDRVFRVSRGDEGEGIVEFDSAFGIYSLVVDAPKYRCAASDYLYFIAGHDRSITEKLADGAPPARPILVSGSAPQSFLYVAPTFVVFDKSQTACNKPLPAAIPTEVSVENDQDAFYASLLPDPSAAPNRSSLRCDCARRRTSTTTCGSRCRSRCPGAAGRRASRST